MMKTAIMLMFGIVTIVLAGCNVRKQYIIKDGAPRADIVIAGKPTRSVKLAARELQEHIKKISGAQLAIVTTPSTDLPVHIYLGPSDAATKTGVDAGGLQRDMYRVVSGANWLALLGHDFDYRPWEPAIMSRADGPKAQADWEKRTGESWLSPQFGHFKLYNKELDIWTMDGVGTLYAVHDFLRGLGVEWYLPGELGAVIPQMKDIPLPQLDKAVKPDIGRRRMTFVQFDSTAPGITDDVLWFFRLGLGEDHLVYIMHSIQLILGHPEMRQKHPDYYALFHGKRDFDSRGAGKPCLSSPGLCDAMIKYARAYFDNYPETTMFPIMPSDAYSNLCQCELCKGKDTPERGHEGRLSDYVWDFVNRVAIEVEKTHPNKMITCCAYSAYYLPPEKIEKLNKNVAVCICRARLFDASVPGNRSKALAVREAWLKKTAPGYLYTWEYYLINGSDKEMAGVPVIFPHVIAEDLKSLQGKCRGEFCEVSKTPDKKPDFTGLNHLNIYVTARFYWDAGQDVDALLGRYYERFFGPAKADMQAFGELVEHSWWQLKAEDIVRLQALLAQAAKAAGDTVYGRRVALIRGECADKLKQLYLRKTEKRDYGRIVIPDDAAVAPVLDGRMDDPFWKDLPEFPLREAVTGGVPGAPTFVKLGCDGSNLVLSVKCMEPDMGSLKVSGTEKDDSNVWIDDEIELILRTPDHSYYQFAINSAGACVDMDRAQPGLSGMAWDAGVQTATAKGTNWWGVEMRIPLKSLGEKKPAVGAPWFVNVGRQRPRGKESEISVLVPPGRKTFHDVDKMFLLFFKTEGLEPEP